MSIISQVCSEREAPAMAYNKKVEEFRDAEYPMMKGESPCPSDV